MKVRIKRIDHNLPLPEYHTSGAAGFDIYTRIAATIEPHQMKILPTNLVVETPQDYFLMMVARSSTCRKTGLVLANAVAIFDTDFRGDNDEMLIQAYNQTDQPVTVEPGQRLAQGIFVKYDRADWEEVSVMDAPDRGGLGSTG